MNWLERNQAYVKQNGGRKLTAKQLRRWRAKDRREQGRTDEPEQQLADSEQP